MTSYFTQTNPEDCLQPPPNFSFVANGIYRGSYFNSKNFPFIKTLHLKSILFLCPEEYSNKEFLKENGINLINVPLEGNKEPFKLIPTELMDQAVTVLADKRNYPIYVHCNKGKHRTGSVIGCFRKLQMWSLTSIFEEYRRFTGKRARQIDEQFMELYIPKLDRLEHDYLPEFLSHLK